MTVFLCEDSVCGILTGVYDAWDSRLGHANVKLALKKGYQPEFFTDCREVGPDAEKADKVLRTLDRKMYLEDFEALYQALLSADDQKADDIYRMIVLALHTGKKTTSRMDAAGVLSDKAKKIFRGTIDFRKGCAGSVGNEKEDVLLLDDTIVNQTIPLILCNEEDVEGNHGASIGKIDEELLFYLESRGISEENVYDMMAKARINAVCNKITDEGTKRKVQEYLEGMKENEQEL